MTTHVMHKCPSPDAKSWIESAKLMHGWPHDDKVAVNKMRKGRDACPWCNTPLTDPSFEPVSGADAQLLAVNQRGRQFLTGGTGTKAQNANLTQENRQLSKKVDDLSAKLDRLLKEKGA